jgi:hypothetical protein
MNFTVQGKKATQAVARLIEKSGGPSDYLRISKLVYLSDRESILKRGIPIVGGEYFSMRMGPVISQIMDFVHSRNAPGWKSTISIRHGNEIRLERIPDSDALSKSEMDILDSTVRQHLNKTTDELVHWCHLNCPEYEKVTGQGRKPITVESILKSEGRSASKIKAIVEEAEHLEEMDRLFA